MAFRGHYEHSLDAKDRLTVPARFRAPLSDGVVLSAGLDPCVAVHTPDSFDSFSTTFLAQLNPLGAEGRKLRRFFHGSSYEETLDSAGRIRLPRHLVAHAGLDGGCVVIGMDDHFEIWDAKRWADYEAEMRTSVVDAAESLAHPTG